MGSVADGLDLQARLQGKGAGRTAGLVMQGQVHERAVSARLTGATGVVGVTIRWQVLATPTGSSTSVTSLTDWA
jgi:hypothetical protein